MKIIEASMRNGTAVVVGMIFSVLFGYLAITRIPIQLNPTIETPAITVETLYPGASATEVEQEITLKQEETLAAVENLREMRSVSQEGLSRITLEFDWGVNKDLAGIDVLKKLNLVEDLPEDAEEPQILTVNREEEETVLWLNLKTDLPVNIQRQIADDLVLPALERVEGVGAVRDYGGAEREIHVLVDPMALAARELTLNEIAQALREQNRNVRGGDINRGATRFIVRTPAQFDSLEQIAQTVVANGAQGPIRIRDIGRVEDAHKDQEVIVRVKGQPTIAMGIVKKTGENTLEVADLVKEEVGRLNESLRPRGVEIEVAYDSSIYIWESIYQVRDSLILGGILAGAVLWFFLRSVASTIIVSLMIPTCMIGTFVLLAAFGRSVNVISLAGLGFASGMIVDNGIVVIENIYRHRTELGKSIIRAAYDGAVEVWAPIVASSLTTLAVFIPILFIKEESGQLFRDIAYSISFAIILSMLAAITIVPMLASRWLRLPVGHHRRENAAGETSNRENAAEQNGADGNSRRGFLASLAVGLHRLVDPIFGWLGGIVSAVFMGVARAGVRSLVLGLIILATIAGLFLISYFIVPPAEYLPTGNQNFVIGMVKLPAGRSLEGSEALLAPMERQVLQLRELQNTFFVILRDMPIFGVIIKPEFSAKEDIQRVVEQLNGFAFSHYPFPDVLPIIFQVPVFSRGLGVGKGMSIDIRGPDIQKLKELSERLMGQLRSIPGVMQIRPSLDFGNPELQVIPNRERLADLGMTASDVAETVETLLEGRITSLYREGGKEYDLKLKALEQDILSPADLAAVTVAAPGGEKVKLADVARIELREGPVRIEHLEQERSVTLEVTVAENVALGDAIDNVQTQIIEPLLAALPFEYSISMSGTADDLARTKEALTGSFILALLIIYLLMAALFQSFLYPLVVMFSVPLGMTGALLGIWITGVEFNVITMLGFILLAGVVVNNAILLVDVTLALVREGITVNDAVLEAIRRRIRPIFMTSVTSVLGMLPLALGQGSGSELYQGLGVAVIGGLLISTLFTLVMIPLILNYVLIMREGLLRLVGREDLSERRAQERLRELDAHI